MHLKEELKQFSDVSYACFTHKERCSVATAVFDDHVKKYCSTEKDIQPPMKTLIIEADIYKSNGSLHDNVIHSQLVRLCADESVKTSNRDRVDPALKLSSGCPFIINSNDHMDQKMLEKELCVI